MIINVTLHSYNAGRKNVYVFPVPVGAVETRSLLGHLMRYSTISAWNQHTCLPQISSLCLQITLAVAYWGVWVQAEMSSISDLCVRCREWTLTTRSRIES